MGVVRTFQHVRLFREMTVIENLLVAQHQQLKTGLFSGLLKTLFPSRPERSARPRRHGLSALVCWNMPTVRRVTAYGDQRRLEIACLYGNAAGDFNARRTGSRS